MTAEQASHFAALAMRAGRTLDDAVQEALAAWAERAMDLAELRASLDHAEAALAQDAGVAITADSMASLAADICHRGRERHRGEHS